MAATIRCGNDLTALLADIRRCRICAEEPNGAPLPHEPRPVLQASRTARLAIFGQAPGVRAHNSGQPFLDPSGDRLRDWLGITKAEFYDSRRLAIVPMGFCFPGYDAKGGDLPPRSECANRWRARLMEALPNLQTSVLVGGYAQKWHLGKRGGNTVSATVADWRSYAPSYFPTPHPSWRNNSWLKKNPWFANELLPALRERVGELI